MSQVLDPCADDTVSVGQALFDVVPIMSSLNAADNSSGHPKHASQSSALAKSLCFIANKKNIFISKFGSAVRFSESVAKLTYTIGTVVTSASQKKVIWINALSIVARMAHENVTRNFFVARKFIRQAVSATIITPVLSFRNPKHAVAKCHYAALPLPALIFPGLGKFTLKSLAQSFVHSRNENDNNTVVNLKNTGGLVYGV